MSSKWYRLGDNCLKIGSGATPKGGKDTYLDSGHFALIRSQNVYNDGFKPAGLVYISIDQARKLDSVSVEAGDVLLNITGDSVARACLATKKHLPARVNQHVAIIRPNPEILDSRFLRYFLVSPYQQGLMLGMAAAGATRNALTKGMIEDFKIPCPPLENQIAIADALTALDDCISILRETNTTLEAMAQAVFKSWFVDFDPVRSKAEGRQPERMDAATAALFPDSFEESELGLVPKGWSVGTLGDIAMTARQQRQVSKLHADLNYVGLEHIPRKSLSLTSWGNAEGLESAKSVFSEGDILFGKLRPYFHKVVIAPFSGVCSTDILVCQPRNKSYFGVVAMHLFSETLISYADRLSNGAKMPRVNWKDLAAYKISLPPAEVAGKFKDEINPLITSITKNTLQAQTLTKLRETLLPKLISGEIRLPEAELIISKTVSA